MCAVIGCVIKKPSKEDFALLKRVLLESKIRGMHATGISYLPNWTDGINSIIEPRPAHEFVFLHLHDDNLKSMVNEDGNLYLIAHCRYSTSDLEFNQPIYTKDKAIAHNGVITQELPEKWKELYGYDCVTKNDSELVLHSEDPLSEFPDMSMSVCSLTADKKLTAYRNGKRPIYLSKLDNGFMITSTSDIAIRSGLKNPEELKMNHYYTIDEAVNLTIKEVSINGDDLQRVNNVS
jgi:glutamine phosphoribosylpyrophosphate amidotransferase